MTWSRGSLLPMLLLAAGTANASLMTIDAGSYSISYESSFWNAPAAGSGNVFQFKFAGTTSYGISAALDVEAPTFAGAYDSDPYYFGVYGSDAGRPDKINVFNTVTVSADSGYQINSIRSGATGLLGVHINPHEAGSDATAWGGMGTVERWLTSASASLIDSRTEVGKGVGPFHSIQKEGASYYSSAASDWNYEVNDVAAFDRGTSYAALDSYTIWSRIDIRNVSADVQVSQFGAYFDVDVSAIPEPNSLLILLTSLGILAAISRGRAAIEA